jgi:predicted 2-oxoglutarate/Fe(II)-dependent dioxygenase YbiX|tara:strand:- start:912 stop:1493 length:582 start_codon:yes stop_codon:yes gene_type:complete
MEIKNGLHSYIKISDNFICEDQLKILTKVCKNHEKFKDGIIVNDKQLSLDKDVRNVQIWEMENLKTKDYTQLYWTNFFACYFKKALKDYIEFLNLHIGIELVDIQILKYTKGGHYKFHVDSATSIPRTISCIFFINDDYEGGDLLFRFPNEKQVLKVEKIKNRMIIWPSNFLYPHSVSPITKGERYSVVCWSR